jgi:hypothetical protein
MEDQPLDGESPSPQSAAVETPHTLSATAEPPGEPSTTADASSEAISTAELSLTAPPPTTTSAASTAASAAASAAAWGAAALGSGLGRMRRRKNATPTPNGDADSSDETDADWVFVESASPTKQTATITALQHLAAYETARCDEWRAISQQYSSAYDALRKQCQAGREEQQECLAYLQQRTQADLEYARKLSGQRLGGRPLAERAKHGANGVAAAASPTALGDASGAADLRCVQGVLACAVAQCAAKLQRHAAEREALAKDVAESRAAYAGAADQASAAFGAAVDELRRADAGCAGAFAAHRAVVEAAARGEASADAWISELHYRCLVGGFDAKLWRAGSTVRELLERFRVVEHRRVGAAHSALRQLVSLQQRLWADVAESTTAVAELFADADLPPSTGLSDAADGPEALALESLVSTDARREYLARPPPPPSRLVAHEGRLLSQRSITRKWAPCYAVVTADRWLHAFSAPVDDDADAAGGAAPPSSSLEDRNLLFSVRCADDAAATASATQPLGFVVPTVVAAGLLGKVGLASDRSTLTLRAPSEAELAAWLEALALPPAAVDGGGDDAGDDAPAPAIEEEDDEVEAQAAVDLLAL